MRAWTPYTKREVSTQSWIVDVGGVDYTVSIDCDEAGKASVRVDDHLVARPLSPDDSEREVNVHGVLYLVVRLSTHRFDLMLAPPDRQTRAVKSPRRLPTVTTRTPAIAYERPAPPPNAIVIPLPMILGAAIMVVLAVYIVGFARESLRYVKIPWRLYEAGDGTFSVSFPGEPAREHHSHNVDGEIRTITTLTARFEDHLYAVRYTDLRGVVTPETAPGVLSRALDDWARAQEAVVVTRDASAHHGDPSIDFSAQISDVFTARGMATLRRRRVFVIWVRTPPNQKRTSDTTRFLDSFRLH